MSQCLFILYFTCCFFIPGWLLFNLLSLRRYVFLLSFSLSYAFLTAVLIVLQIAKLPVSFFAPVILIGSVVFGMLWLIRLFWVNKIVLNRKRDEAAAGQRYLRYRPSILIAFSIILGLLWIYLWWAGPYLEIPSDVWTHVVRFRETKEQIDTGQFATAPSINFFLQQRRDWFVIVAFLIRWSHLPAPHLLTPLTVIVLSFFCSGIFFTALALFRNFRMTIRQKSALAAAAAIFCAISMGTSVFAYIRYYAFAPAILNYILFLTAVIVAYDWLNAKKWKSHAVWIVPLLILVMNTIHKQEALFTCFMIMGIAFVNIAHWLISRRQDTILICGERPLEYRLPVKSVVIAGVSLIVWLGLFFLMRYNNPINWLAPNTILPNIPVPEASVPVIFKAFTITAPHDPILRLFVYQLYMMYETIGCWGIFVYLLFLIWFRQLAKSSYLIAGMLMPLFTILNPITVDFFVRLTTSSNVHPITLYRFNYMLPLPFVAAFAFVKAFETVFQRNPRGWNCGILAGRKRIFAGIAGIIIITGLIGLLFPINNRWIYAPNSRIYTLNKQSEHDAHWRDDLIEFAGNREGRLVITDPVTGRIFFQLYPEYNYIGLQWMQSNDPEKEFAGIIKQDRNILNKGLIIINRHDGLPSVTGRISKHWAEDALQTSRYYSTNAIAFVESQTNRFKLIWAKDRIEVFQIIP